MDVLVKPMNGAQHLFQLKFLYFCFLHDMSTLCSHKMIANGCGGYTAYVSGSVPGMCLAAKLSSVTSRSHRLMGAYCICTQLCLETGQFHLFRFDFTILMSVLAPTRQASTIYST
jgi:hypothetical protein